MTSLLAPSCAPASIIWAVSSSNSGTVSSALSPRATAASPSRKSLAFPATRSARGRHSSVAPSSLGDSDIQQPPSLESPAERDLVGVFQLTANRQAAGGPGDPHPHW